MALAYCLVRTESIVGADCAESGLDRFAELQQGDRCEREEGESASRALLEAHANLECQAMRLAQSLSDAWTSGFVRAVSVLVGGTVVAHGISALILPIVTRLYTPHEFSMLAVFSSLAAIISVSSCLRFDVAVALPEDDGDAANVLALAITCAALISAVLAILVLGAPGSVATWLNQPDLAPYLWLLPLGVLFASSHSALQFWFVRRKAFHSIARTRIVQSSIAGGTQVGSGSAGLGPLGLIAGLVLNHGAGCIGLGYRLVSLERQLLGSISWNRIRGMFGAYAMFPKFSTFEALSNSAGIQLPIIMIAALAVGPEAGYLLLAMQVMQIPTALIGTAIGQVYISRAPDEFRAGRLGDFTADVFGGLVKSGVGPLIFVGIASPSVFAILFGIEWGRAGNLVSWMTPWFVMQFLAVPISMALHVTGRQRTALVLQLLGLAFRVTTVFGASKLAVGAISEVYALSGFVFYLLYLVVVLRVTCARGTEIAGRIGDSIPMVAAWTALGGLVALVVGAFDPPPQ